MIADRLYKIEQRIAEAATRSGRSASDVTIVAVSKHQSVEAMQHYADILATRSQEVVFGESYVQEYASKQKVLCRPSKVHLIGALQSNKAARAVELFDLIESIDSLRIAGYVSNQAIKRRKIQPVFLQINVSNDRDKHGFDPDEIQVLLERSILGLEGLDVQGLMTITRLYHDPDDARGDFKALRMLRDTLQSKFHFARPLALSMGMSADYEIAIEEGATHVRIGTALFGERS